MRIDHLADVGLSGGQFAPSATQSHINADDASLGHRKKPRLAEEADDYPHIVAQIDERHRVIACRDDMQWIAQVRRGSAWRGDGYFRTRTGLMRRCGGLNPEAAKILAALPERYVEGHPGRLGGANVA